MSRFDRAGRQTETFDGAPLKTREDVKRYLVQRYAELNETVERATGWSIAKQAVLLLLSVVAFLQYYFLDLMAEIASIPMVTFPAPGVTG